jgi:hypothetical protein
VGGRFCEPGCTCGRHAPTPERGHRISAAKKGHALTHGMTQHPLYVTWRNMLARCYNPNYTGYRYWGGRGVTVCPEWHDVVAFTAWIEEHLGPRPAGHALDRIDNEGRYEPGNVRWATRSQQNKNRRPVGTVV